MPTIDEAFAKLKGEGRKAFVPFVTAGAPDLEFTAVALTKLAESGAAVCEVGIPYSDPIADGPVIQASYTRALARKIKLADILATLGHVTPTLPCPVVTMVSYAIVFRHGPEQYVQMCKQMGVAGAIVPDLLVEEADDFAAICRKHDFSLIQLVTPTTSRERQKRIAEQTTGFLYYVSVAGITGERKELPPELADNLAWLREQTDLPICVGFGVSGPEQAKQLKDLADGVIVGSAIVRRIAEAETKGKDWALNEIGEFAREMVAALA